MADTDADETEPRTTWFVIMAGHVLRDGLAGNHFSFTNTYDLTARATEKGLFEAVKRDAAPKNDCEPDDLMVTFYRAVPNATASC